MARPFRLHVLRLMMIAMLAIQGGLAWHASVHALDDHVASARVASTPVAIMGQAHHQNHGHHHDAGDICAFCAFAQDFAKLVTWHAPVLWGQIVLPVWVMDVPIIRMTVAVGRPYTARAPPAAL